MKFSLSQPVTGSCHCFYRIWWEGMWYICLSHFIIFVDKKIWLLSRPLDCWSAINGRSILWLKTRGGEGHGLDFGSLVKIRQQSEVGETRSHLWKQKGAEGQGLDFGLEVKN